MKKTTIEIKDPNYIWIADNIYRRYYKSGKVSYRVRVGGVSAYETKRKDAISTRESLRKELQIRQYSN